MDYGSAKAAASRAHWPVSGLMAWRELNAPFAEQVFSCCPSGHWLSHYEPDYTTNERFFTKYLSCATFFVA
jgi:hypothetical protein